MTRRQTVLIIDDDQEIVRWISAVLKRLDVGVLAATDGGAGLTCAQEHRPDLILLDLNMPIMHGFGVCEQLRARPRTADIPIIFLTGADDREGKVKAFSLGAVDYVTKPFDVAELQARVRAVLRMQALVEALEVQASTDHLTGLPNREAFRAKLDACLQADGDEGGAFALLFLDLDRFKVINDSMGHAVGDQLLVKVAESLRRCVAEASGLPEGAEGPVVARMGGDEFTILLPGVVQTDAAARCAERIREELGKPHTIAGYTVTTGVSIGIRMSGLGGGDADALLRDADNAMYHAKGNGKNRCAIFDEAMHQRAIKRLEIEHDLHHALQAGQLVLYHQPTYALESGQLKGFESLVRWRHPERGLIYPGEFITVAEDNGLIIEIGRWVLRKACQEAAVWSAMQPDLPLTLSVNVSKRQIISPGFLEDVERILADTGVNPSLVCLEVTESIIMHDVQTVLPVLRRLREMGLSLAMDDFGTGYSSLASLHRFPIDVVKIDRAFVEPMTTNRVYSAIIDAIINLAHNLGMVVVAEGVETHDQLVQLQTLGCDSVQGFWFSPPVACEQARAFIRSPQPHLSIAPTLPSRNVA